MLMILQLGANLNEDQYSSARMDHWQRQQGPDHRKQISTEDYIRTFAAPYSHV